MSPAGRGSRSNLWAEGLLFLAAVILTRALALAVIAHFVGGREFTDDVWRHLDLIRAPFDALIGRGSLDVSMYPPLLGALEGLVARPLQLFMPDFYAVRLTFCFYEAVTALLFWLLLARLVPDPRKRYLAALGFVVIPMGPITSAVMAQDEVIGGCFLAATLLLFSMGLLPWALVVCGLGVAAGKIFLLVPLAALILLPREMSFIRRALFGGAPVALIYGWVYAASMLNGGTPPLAGFTPPFACVINVWGLLVPAGYVQPESARGISAVLAFFAAMTPLLVLKARRVSPDALQMSALCGAMLAWIFALFHHVNPEYYFIVLPLLLLVFNTPRSLAMLALAMTLPWVVNFLYGVSHADPGADNAAGKSGFVRLYARFCSIPPSRLHTLSLWLCVAATIGLAAATTLRALRPPGTPILPKSTKS